MSDERDHPTPAAPTLAGSTLLQIMLPLQTMHDLAVEAQEIGEANPAEYIRTKLAMRPRPILREAHEAARNPSLN